MATLHYRHDFTGGGFTFGCNTAVNELRTEKRDRVTCPQCRAYIRRLQRKPITVRLGDNGNVVRLMSDTKLGTYRVTGRRGRAVTVSATIGGRVYDGESNGITYPAVLLPAAPIRERFVNDRRGE